MVVRRQSRAFTLVELLVVISIMALLIGIILPALSHARFAGKELTCLSQLRQIATAQQAYAVDAHDYYAPGYTSDDPDNLIDHSWYRAMHEYTDGNPKMWDCPVARDRFTDFDYMLEVIPGFETLGLTWSQVNYGLPVFAYSYNGIKQNTYGGSMGLSFEKGLYYSDRSVWTDMTPCRTDQVKHPDMFSMAGDTNNIGVNNRLEELTRRIGYHGCNMMRCQNSAHSDIAPGDEEFPGDAAANQWVFGDGHAKKMTYAEVLDDKGRMFRRDGGYYFSYRGG